MRREIGSEFHIEDSNEYKSNPNSVLKYLSEYNTLYFDSGRSALRAVLEGVSSNRVLLPAYMCESVRECFPNSHVDYYAVDQDFNIVWSDLLRKAECGFDVVYIHYFNGKILPIYDFDKLLNIKDRHGFVIIEDTTHSFLSAKHTVGDYCICSLRKWFPISDGGVLYSKNELPQGEYPECPWAEKKIEAMHRKAAYLQGDNICKNVFLEAFALSEKALDGQSRCYSISSSALEMIRSVNIEEIVNIRRENFSILSKRLGEIGMSVVPADGINQTPLFCIIKVGNRDYLRKYLVENKIYCPVHWPLYDELNELNNIVEIQAEELSIPIDQRYKQEDMEYIAKIICEYMMSFCQRR